ncbi:hypothetical protein G9A89_004272 [Geosiphon pyriformis]|nr:hypothetical protein G9A89_004272 [Geosiphon pyriformis]
MSTLVFTKIFDFMRDEPVKHITAGSAQKTIKQELLKLTIDAIRSMKNIAGEDSERFRKISNIPLEPTSTQVTTFERSERCFDSDISECARKWREIIYTLSSYTNIILFCVSSNINAIAGKVLVLYDIIGTEIQLNVLIRDNLDIHRYYHLKKTQIPIQWSEQALSTLPEFVELLLNLRVFILVHQISFMRTTKVILFYIEYPGR